MEKCWHKDAKERPAATDVVNKRCTQNAQFVALSSVYKGISRFSVDCEIGAPSVSTAETIFLPFD